MDSVDILLIEDDADISHLICDALKKEFFKVDWASDGKTGLHMFHSNKYQMVITDLMLPGIDGYDIIRSIREQSTIPIIVVSVKDMEAEKIVGIRLGADDYITKPFSVSELVERVKAQLRRYLQWSNKNTNEEEQVLRHGALSLNLREYKACVNGREVPLTAKEFEIMKLLIENPGRVYTKDQIYSIVWGAEYYIDANTINVHMRRLRKKLEPEPDNPRIIETVWGIGYKLYT